MSNDPKSTKQYTDHIWREWKRNLISITRNACITHPFGCFVVKWMQRKCPPSSKTKGYNTTHRKTATLSFEITWSINHTSKQVEINLPFNWLVNSTSEKKCLSSACQNSTAQSIWFVFFVTGVYPDGDSRLPNPRNFQFISQQAYEHINQLAPLSG